MSSPPLPESTLVGTAETYLTSIEQVYRLPVCTFTLRLIASLREAHFDNGNMLMALTQIERALLPTVRTAVVQPVTRTQFIQPPTT
jgi:hypothetical protein